MPTPPVEIPLPSGGRLTGHLALPEGPGPHPGLVVLHEIFGLNNDIRGIADRFASDGYAALAPDLYSFGNRRVCLTRTLVGPKSEVLDHIGAARDALGARPEVEADRIGVVGFCLGGGFALLFGTRPGVRAAAVNYGAVPRKREALEGVCPVVANYGALDRVFAPQARRLEGHLSALGVDHDVKIYPDAGHSFLSRANAPGWMARLPSPMRPGYVEADAEDAWARMLAWFAAHI